MAKHKCSEWSLTLIEFDNPSLTERHKIAARNRIREKHRSDLKERLKRDPKLTRQELQEVACGTYEALLDHDPEWFDQILPRKRPEQPAQRSARIDRKELDTKKSEEIEKFLVTIIDTEERPTRVTQTRLLRHVDILTLYRENPDKFPNVSKVILNNSETQEQHDKRKLKWAIKKMHKNYIELSLNTLRRVAGMRAEKVRDYKEFILNIADEIGAEVNDRAFFLN